MVFYKKPNATEPRLHWIIEGTYAPIFNDGDLIKCVPVCFEWAENQDGHYEIADVRYGSIDGIIMPEVIDIEQAIQEHLGLKETLIFPDKYYHDPKL